MGGAVAAGDAGVQEPDGAALCILLEVHHLPGPDHALVDVLPAPQVRLHAGEWVGRQVFQSQAPVAFEALLPHVVVEPFDGIDDALLFHGVLLPARQCRRSGASGYTTGQTSETMHGSRGFARHAAAAVVAIDGIARYVIPFCLKPIPETQGSRMLVISEARGKGPSRSRRADLRAGAGSHPVLRGQGGDARAAGGAVAGDPRTHHQHARLHERGEGRWGSRSSPIFGTIPKDRACRRSWPPSPFTAPRAASDRWC